MVSPSLSFVFLSKLYQTTAECATAFPLDIFRPARMMVLSILKLCSKFSAKLSFPLDFVGSSCYGKDTRRARLPAVPSKFIYWQTCRKAGTQSQMGLTPVPLWERVMTAGCTFFFSLSPVCFAGGSFFICRPTVGSRGSYHTKENQRRIY